MKVTNINLSLNNNAKSKRVAFGTIELDKVLVITGVTVFTGKNGEFVKMPQFQKEDKSYMDIVFPTTAELRQQINEAVLTKLAELKKSAN